MSNGLRDALGFIRHSSMPGFTKYTNIVNIPGVDDPTEEIELFTIDEWNGIKERLKEPDEEKWWLPKCECGCEKIYGKDTNLHSTWCPKYKR